MLIPIGLTDIVENTAILCDDSPSHFSETYNADTLAQHGYTTQFAQDNQSYSRDIATVRGLHFQAPLIGRAKSSLARAASLKS